MTRVMWQPTLQEIQKTNMYKFMRQESQGPRDEKCEADYSTLYRWSVAKPEEFWAAVWSFCGIRGEQGFPAFEPSTDSPMMKSRFFPNASVNLAENLLGECNDDPAVLEADERGLQTTYTRRDLHLATGRAQRVMKRLGVKKGDPVAGVLSNNFDSLAYMLGALAMGAIWTSCAPEFGRGGVLDRFLQVEPKVLVVTHSYTYNGKSHNLAERTAKIAAEIPSIESLLVVGNGDLPESESITVVSNKAFDDETGYLPDFESLPFDHPAFVLYTSGTTGLPKSIVHRAGGVLLNMLKEHRLHGDIRDGDRLLYYTNTAWMMYHWSIAALACGASVVLYDGSALPSDDPDILMRLVDETDCTQFGTSPKYISTLAKYGISPNRKYEFANLRAIFSAGAPLTDDHFEWVYNDVSSRIMLASISGGTEILGCFVLGNPMKPVISGEIQGPGLGMAVSAFDERRLPVIGKPGDLVCTEPFPSMPLTFWGEDGDAKYKSAYFSEIEEAWFHGDLAEFTASGGVVISGRTDTTLKPGGVRIGTSEIYRVVETDSTIKDSLVIGYPTEDDMEIWLFVVPERNGYVDYQLLKKKLRDEASPRHVPARVFEVPDVPYNLAGKKAEPAVLKMTQGSDVKNKDSLANPVCLDYFNKDSLDSRRVV